MAMSSRGSTCTKRSTSASTSPHPRSSTTQPPSAAAAAASDRLESASQQLHPYGFFGHARSTSRDLSESEIFLQLQQDQTTTLFNTSTPIAIASNNGAFQTQQPPSSTRPESAQSAGDLGVRPLLSITTTQATRGVNVHAPGDNQTVTSTTNPSIEDSLLQQTLLMGDSGQQPFTFDGTGSSIDYTQALAQAQLQQLQHQRQQQQLHQQQQQVPQFSLSQQNYDGTMTTLHHALPDGVDLTAAPGHHISRRTSPFEASAGSPLQPAQQRPLTSTNSLLSLQDPYANGLDVPSPYSDTASFQGSEFDDHGSPHPDMFALSRTNSMTSAFRPDMSYLFSHPGSPYVDAFDASANQPPPLPQQQSADHASFNFLQPQQVSQRNTASGASPQMAQMAFNGMQPFSTTTPVAIPLEQPGSAFGEYTPGISLNPPTPSGHGRLGMPDAQAESAFSFMQTMPVITTTHHAHDQGSHDAQQLDHGVSALERALQEQQQQQLEQLRQHHLQQQQTLLGVEEAARRGRSLSDGGLRRYEEGAARDASRGSSRGRSRDTGRRPYGSTGVSPQLSATQLMYAQTAAAAGGGFTAGAAVGAVTSPGLLGVDLRSLSPHGRSGSAGPGGKHPRRQSWSGQRQDGLSPREVSPSGSSVHSFVTNEGNASGAPTPHAKAKNPATFICPVAGCSKAFTRAYNLRSHQRTHTNERPFLCEVCGKAFARQHDRKRHEALHSGVKAHACPGCNKKFARMDALSRHFKSETGKDCIEGREEYARYVDGQASVEQQQMQAEREASHTSQPEALTMDFGDAVYDEDHKR